MKHPPTFVVYSNSTKYPVYVPITLSIGGIDPTTRPLRRRKYQLGESLWTPMGLNLVIMYAASCMIWAHFAWIANPPFMHCSAHLTGWRGEGEPCVIHLFK
jgi:hypothetical protein